MNEEKQYKISVPNNGENISDASEILTAIVTKSVDKGYAFTVSAEKTCPTFEGFILNEMSDTLTAGHIALALVFGVFIREVIIKGKSLLRL